MKSREKALRPAGTAPSLHDEGVRRGRGEEFCIKISF
jgi:hypothetical protein